MLYRLSRFSVLHRVLRRAAYGILWYLPERAKWPLVGVTHTLRMPYRLLAKGDTVVQIGAPWDTLRAGRSRAIHFARRVGPEGHVVVIEPDPDNVRALERFIGQHQNLSISVIPLGAWSEPGTLRFLVDPENPAANLVENVADRSRDDLGRFRKTEIPVDTLESILNGARVECPTLVSITTNGSESEILKGMGRYLDCVRWISTIGDPSRIPILRQLGFCKIGGDDRGFTYLNSSYTQNN